MRSTEREPPPQGSGPNAAAAIGTWLTGSNSKSHHTALGCDQQDPGRRPKDAIISDAGPIWGTLDRRCRMAGEPG